MFEKMLADQLAERQDALRAIQNMHGRRWVPPDPRARAAFSRAGRGRGRSPVQTRFKRLPATIQRDQQALTLRTTLGWTYARIGQELGMSGSSAFEACQRARRDQLIQGQSPPDEPALVPAGRNPRHFEPPPVPVLSLFPRAARTGILKSCGCFVHAGTPVGLIRNRQVCIPHALQAAGITWDELAADPTLARNLQLKRWGKG